MITLKLDSKRKSFDNIECEGDCIPINHFLGIFKYSSCSTEYEPLSEKLFYKLKNALPERAFYPCWDDYTEMTASEWVKCSEFLMDNAHCITQLNDTETDLSKRKHF